MNWKKLLNNERFGKDLVNESDAFFEKYKYNEYAKDYQKIISSASFRRLQDKTQVFPLDKSDFVRTRLTHSIETSSIAKKIGSMICYNMNNANTLYKKNYSNIILDNEKYINELALIPDILACAGLLHDIGNPPFGHFGETIMRDWFKDNLLKLNFKNNKIINILTKEQLEGLYNFDGNAQALRVIGKLHYMNSDYGMNLTKSLLNVLIKYPVSATYVDKNHKNIKYHKLGFFDIDKKMFDNISHATGTIVSGEVVRHPLTFILEAADDIAYATADIEDAFKKGLFNREQMIAIFDREIKKRAGKINEKNVELLMKLKDNTFKLKTSKETKKQDLYILQCWLDSSREWLIYCAAYGFINHYDEIMDGEFNGELLDGTNQAHLIPILKEVAKEYIFNDQKIMKVELSGSVCLNFLLNKFIHAILYYECEDSDFKQTREDKKLINLFPENYLENYKFESKYINDENLKLYYRIHLVIDFISGMTDSYALRLYRELTGIGM